jgi:hypothetical protein
MYAIGAACKGYVDSVINDQSAATIANQQSYLSRQKVKISSVETLGAQLDKRGAAIKQLAQDSRWIATPDLVQVEDSVERWQIERRHRPY